MNELCLVVQGLYAGSSTNQENIDYFVLLRSAEAYSQICTNNLILWLFTTFYGKKDAVVHSLMNV